MFDIPGAPVEVLLFALFAFLSVVGALSVIISSDPFISALSLLTNFASLGALYLFLDSPFVAIAQIIVYAGAVVVLFLFVMAYLGDRREVATRATRARWLFIPGALVALMFVGLVWGVLNQADFPTAASIANPADTQFGFGSAQAVGELFLTKYILEFEVTSLVLLVAAIGGIVLGLTGRARQAKLRAELGTSSSETHRKHERDLRKARRRAEVQASERGGRPVVGAASSNGRGSSSEGDA